MPHDLQSAVINLQAKVALLDPAHINTIVEQLQVSSEVINVSVSV